MILKVKNQAGQSLLELVVAISVITVGLFSVWNLFISNYNGEQEAGARILSVNLAREGIEIIKNMRDSNWLAIDNNDPCSYNGILSDPCRWDSGLDGDGSGVIQNILSENIYLDYAPNALSDEATRIYQDPDSSLYSNNSLGRPTTYRRLITIKSICCADADFNLQCDDLSVDFVVQNTCSGSELKMGLDVQSTVSWSINGQARETSVNERIFNWK